MALLLCAIFTWILALGMTARAISLWRRPKTMWRKGSQSRGYQRAFVPKAAAAVGLAVICTVLAAGRPTGPTDTGWLVVLAVGFFTLLGSYCLVGLIVSFNRPRLLMPRHLHSERGMIMAWLEGRYLSRDKELRQH